MYSSVKLRVRRGLDCTIRNVLDRGHARLARPGGIPDYLFVNGRQATALQLDLHLMNYPAAEDRQWDAVVARISLCWQSTRCEANNRKGTEWPADLERCDR
jgi:hypothetical protein